MNDLTQQTHDFLVEGFSVDMTNAERLSLIMFLEQRIKDFTGDNMDSVDSPLTHHFAPSVYGREMLIKAGSLIVGKTHRHSHLNVISKGRILVATEYGIETLEAPCTFVSPVGIKRAVLALEDTIWTTIHNNPTDTQDLKLLEDDVIVPDSEVITFRTSIGLECIEE